MPVLTIMPTVPPSAYTVADFPGGDTLAHLSNTPDNFVTGNNRSAGW